MAFDVAGLRINDSVDDFQNLVGPAKEYLTVTHDPEGKLFGFSIDRKVYRMIHRRKTKLVNRICDKYGYVTSCSVAISEINSKEKNFLRFFNLYRNDDETLELRARIRRTKIIKRRTLR